jgi:uncharacterized protein
MLPVTETPKGIVFKVYVQPRASKTRIVGLHGDALKITITAPPVDGEANKMCLGFLAKSLGVSKSSLQIVSGETSRTKGICLLFPGDKAPSRAKKKALADLVLSLVCPSK